jgi:hypothetical protein
MTCVPHSLRRRLARLPQPRIRLQVERLEDRNLLASGTFALTPLAQVSSSSPSLPAPPSSPIVFPNSEVEPQVAANPLNTTQAVAIWQQDRYRSVGGARALFFSVTADGNDANGAKWSTPAPIPYFNSTDATFNTIDPVTGQGYARYTDPWVTIAPNGVVWASALAMTPSGPVPGHTAVLVIKGSIVINGDGSASVSWDSAGPTMLIHDDAPPGTDPADLANDKEMVIADPTNSDNVYVVWDRLNQPAPREDFNAAHGLAFREDMMFARTTDGGVTWDGGDYPPAVPGYPASDITNFKENVSAFGNEIVVQPNGDLVDVFTRTNGSGSQAPQAGQNVVGVMRSTDHGFTWSDITTGPSIEAIDVLDPDTGAPVRAGEPLLSVAADPTINGRLYAVWVDGRFSGFTHDDIAFSESDDGGLTWSNPIRVNQTPTNIPAGDQQAFTPAVAVNSAGTVAVTYYDFRNNTSTDVGATTDYWLVHASGSFTNPSSWAADEKRLTSLADGVTGKPFNIENAAPTSRGYFLGDYQGLAAAGQSFYALFAEAGNSPSDPSDIWFRDPPPAPESASVAPVTAATTSASTAAVDALAALGTGESAGSTPAADETSSASASGQARAVDHSFSRERILDRVMNSAAQSADDFWSRGDDTESADDGDALVDAVFADGWNDLLAR